MEKNHKRKRMHFWDRMIADAKMDSAVKAKMAEEAVQDALTGLQNAVNPETYFQAGPDFPFGCPGERDFL